MEDATPTDPTVKKIVLTAGASSPMGETGEIKRRKSRRAPTGGAVTPSPNSPVIVNKMSAATALASTVGTSGGGATSPGTMQQLAASHIPGNDSSKAVGATAPLTAAQAVVGKVAPAAINDPKPIAGGGATKVTLVKSRKAAHRVMLTAGAKKSAPPTKQKTAKKLKVSLTGLSKRLRHAKTIRKGASKKSIADIKKALVDAKLVKEDTKAPEGILRQMYTDYMTLKKKAL